MIFRPTKFNNIFGLIKIKLNKILDLSPTRFQISAQPDFNEVKINQNLYQLIKTCHTLHLVLQKFQQKIHIFQHHYQPNIAMPCASIPIKQNQIINIS
jgi:hypothetical protein